MPQHEAKYVAGDSGFFSGQELADILQDAAEEFGPTGYDYQVQTRGFTNLRIKEITIRTRKASSGRGEA